MLQTVLDSAQVAADTGDVVDGVTDSLHSGGGTGLVADVDAVNAHSLGVHIAHLDLHLVVAVGGIADLESQSGTHVVGVRLAHLDEAGPVAVNVIGFIGRALQLIVVGVHAAFLLRQEELTLSGRAQCAVGGNGEVLVILGGSGDPVGYQAGNRFVRHVRRGHVGQVDNVLAVLELAVLAHGEGVGAVADGQSGAVLHGQLSQVDIGLGVLPTGRTVHGLGEHTDLTTVRLISITIADACTAGSLLHILKCEALRVCASLYIPRLGGGLIHGQGYLRAILLSGQFHAVISSEVSVCIRASSTSFVTCKVRRDGFGNILTGDLRTNLIGAHGDLLAKHRDLHRRSVLACRLLTHGTREAGEVQLEHTGLGIVAQLTVGDNVKGTGNLGNILLISSLDRGVQGAVQQLDAVEVSGVSDTVNFGLQGVNFLLEVGAVDLVVVGAVSGLGSQVVHAVEHVLNLLHRALGGLHQGDAVLDVLGSGVQAGDLGAHLLGNGQRRRHRRG